MSWRAAAAAATRPTPEMHQAIRLPATVPAGVELVVTVMPTGSYDVDDRTDAAVDVRLSFSPAP